MAMQRGGGRGRVRAAITTPYLGDRVVVEADPYAVGAAAEGKRDSGRGGGAGGPPARSELDQLHDLYGPGKGGRRGGGPPRGHAAASDAQNDMYMDEFHRAHAELVSSRGRGGGAGGSRARLADRGGRRSGRGGAGGKEAELAVASAGGGAAGGGGAHPHTTPSVRASFGRGPIDPAGVAMDAGADRGVLCMAVSAAADEAVLGSSDHALYGFNLHNGRLTRTLYTKRCGHSEWVTCCGYLPDGRLVSGGMDNKLCLWAARGATASELLGHSSSVSCVATSPTAQLAISGAYDRTLRVWDCSGRGRELACMRGGHKGAVLDLAWGRDAVISGGRDGLACLWDVERGELSRELRGHKGHVTSVTWAAETGGESVVISGAQDGCVRVWDTRAERCVATIAAHTSEEGSGAIAALAPTMAPAKVVEPIGGNVVVSAGADKSVCALDPRASWEPLHRWTEHRDFIYSMHVAGQFVFSGGGDGMLLVHDVVSGRLRYGLGATDGGAVRAIGATPDRLVAAGDDGKGLVWTFA